MPLALLWKSSQVGEFIRESRTLLLLINLNKQNDFTFYQTPHSYPFFVEFSFSRSGFLVGLSIFLGSACGIRWEDLVWLPHLRTFHPTGIAFVCFVLFFRFSALLFLLLPNLTPKRMNQKHSQHDVFLGLDWRMQRPICSKLGGAVCVTKENTRKQFFVVVLLWTSICFSVGWSEAIYCYTNYLNLLPTCLGINDSNERLT